MNKAYEYRFSILIARIHSMMWPFFTLFMCMWMSAIVFIIIDWNKYPHPPIGALCFCVPMFLMNLYINIVGIQSCWHCQIHNLDWNKNWNEQKTN